ncbi:MAG TPA: hypothetical protein PKD54_12765 [Pirellulaceae bacterium]|nr:hypothetical protein [Pirellulaceae bacterium]
MMWLERSMFLWPGLHRLWRRGDRLSLVVAFGFGVLLNLALVSTLIWPAWLGTQFSSIIWPMLILIWGLSYWSVSHDTRHADNGTHSTLQRPPVTQDTLFIQAQREYLSRNWFQAERLIRRRLQLWPRDAAARLLLVGILRHSDRLDVARHELDFLAGLDDARPWEYEIQRERELIRLIEEQLSGDTSLSDAAQDLHLEGSARIAEEPNTTRDAA